MAKNIVLLRTMKMKCAQNAHSKVSPVNRAVFVSYPVAENVTMRKYANLKMMSYDDKRKVWY